VLGLNMAAPFYLVSPALVLKSHEGFLCH
jgi:hypothetical protein